MRPFNGRQLDPKAVLVKIVADANAGYTTPCVIIAPAVADQLLADGAIRRVGYGGNERYEPTKDGIRTLDRSRHLQAVGGEW